MTKEEHTALCEELLAELGEGEGTGRLPVLVSGILTDAPQLNQIFDDFGLHIVADDVAAQSRQYRTDAAEAGSALDALAVIAFVDANAVIRVVRHQVLFLSIDDERI